MLRSSYKRVAFLAAALIALLLVMSLLYWLGMQHLEGKPRTFLQALQWASGTTSTTGYGFDTSWTHPVMVIYVVFSQFMGVTLMFLVLPIFLVPFLEERFETRLPQESANAKDHVVIFDYGPAVATLVTELQQAKVPAVIIDEDETEARHLLEHGHRVVFGSLDEGALGKSNLMQARALIVNGSDDRNAAAILAARQMGYRGQILALVEDPFHRQPMILAGATGAFTPRHVLGAELAARASQKVSPLVDGIQHLGHLLQVAEVRIARDSVLCGKTLEQAGLGQHSGVAVIGQWSGGKLVAPPTPGMRLEPGGILLLAGGDAGIANFITLCAGARRLRRDGRFLIAGGGEVGRKVAQLLNDCGEKTFVIDRQPGPGVDLVGNVLDTQLLEQAGLKDAQAVILALGADATALFCAVIIRDLAPDVPVIARVNLAENLERIYVAGADFALSIAQVSGKLLAWQLLGKEAVEVDASLRVVKVSARGLAGVHPRVHPGVHPAVHRKQSGLLAQTGCAVVAVERSAALLVEFGAEFAFQADDTVYLCGNGESIQRFYKAFPLA